MILENAVDSVLVEIANALNDLTRSGSDIASSLIMTCYTKNFG